MNIEVQRINLDDYIQTGEGGTALSYTHKDGRSLAKLYNPGFEADIAREEFLTACTVFELGIPSPKPYRLITDGQRVGAEYELIKNKRSYARIISQEPERMEELSVDFARRTRQLHAMKAGTRKLESTKQVLMRFYLEKNMVPDDFRQLVLQFMDTVPEPDTCLHGDLQIGNIITDGQRTLWIDLGSFGYGVPEWDLAFTWRITHETRSDITERLLHLKPDVLVKHWDLFIQAYLGTTDRQRIDETTKRLFPFVAAKMPYMIFMARHHVPDGLVKELYEMFD